MQKLAIKTSTPRPDDGGATFAEWVKIMQAKKVCIATLNPNQIPVKKY